MGKRDLYLSDLYVGKEFKSLNALCREVIGTHPKGGKQKELMTKEMKLYINWTTEGRKITITEIYSTPKEKVDNRGKSEGSRGNNDKYQEDISILIEHYLATSGQEEFKIAITTLAYNSNIVSEVYKEAKNDEDRCFERLVDITNRTAFDNTIFYSSRIISNSVYGALNSLQKQGKLEYERATFVVIDNKVMCTTKEMDKRLNEIKEQAMKEINSKYSFGNKQLAKRFVMNIPKLRKKYYDLVIKKFNREYPKVTKLFVGVIIYTIDCKKQENIIEVSNRLNDTIKNNILMKNKNQVTKVKKQYKKNNEENNNMAFGEGFALQMKPYERDIIEYESSYIEDTITLTKLLCRQIEKTERIKVEMREQSKEIELFKQIESKAIEEAEIEASKEDMNLTYEMTEELKEVPRPKYKNCAFGSPITIGFGYIDEYMYYDYERTEDECITLNTIRDDILEEISKTKRKIEFIEIGFKEGNILELKRKLRRLDSEYDKVNHMIMCA